MGNKAVTLRNDGEYEYSTGKRLLLSIKLNSREQTLEAIEHARKECVKPSSVLASVFSYDDMVKKVHEYLTKKIFNSGTVCSNSSDDVEVLGGLLILYVLANIDDYASIYR